VRILPQTSYLVQPAIIRPVPNNPLLKVYYRDRRAQNIYVASSTDDGINWTSPQKTTLPNNNSGIGLSVLLNGNIVLVYNPMTKDRNKIVISLSTDQGVTWKYTRVLEDSNNTKDEFSYPSVLQTLDGMIQVSYTYLRQTIKYSYFKEDWIINQ